MVVNPSFPEVPALGYENAPPDFIRVSPELTLPFHVAVFMPVRSAIVGSSGAGQRRRGMPLLMRIVDCIRDNAQLRPQRRVLRSALLDDRGTSRYIHTVV